jgi:hypothetical protein
MDKTLIIPTEMTIKEKNHTIKGHVLRAGLWARMKVIEVETADQENFYLIYYKNSLIYGDKLNQVTEGSFIHQAFEKGIAIEAPHPLIKGMIPHLTVTIPNKHKLFTQLQTHFSLQEIAYIATTLDSFFAKDELVKIIDKIFYHYRRSGSFIKSFQIIRILHDFEPTLQSANERLNASEFNKYHDFYHSSSLSAIHQKDPHFVEVHCFQNRANPDKHHFLEEIFTKQNCHAEVLLLWLEKVEKLQKAESIEKYTAIARQLVSMNEWIFILGKIKINPYRVLPEARAVIKQMIDEGDAETAALYLLNYINDLPASYDAILNQLWGNLNARFVAAHLDDFILMLQEHALEDDAKQTEEKIFQLAIILLEEFDLKTVWKKLLPIQTFYSQSLVMQKLKRMIALEEDPDRMMELGEDYAMFHQYDKAIDCFFWEMELEPQNPVPVQKISKMYQQKGMAAEAAAYQKLYAGMVTSRKS